MPVSASFLAYKNPPLPPVYVTRSARPKAVTTLRAKPPVLPLLIASLQRVRASTWHQSGFPTPDFAQSIYCMHVQSSTALLHKSEGRRDYPSPRRSYAMAPTGTVLGRPSCVKRLSRATRTCNSTTCRSNVRAITRWPRRLKQCILVSTRLLR